ncbi:MAG: hypothetical protein M0D55_10090 [Elusimicrobiota bacterium]|nr:MAG: hypothetical protein M0D55_10090 [Elusimicrobiota bacterium]
MRAARDEEGAPSQPRASARARAASTAGAAAFPSYFMLPVERRFSPGTPSARKRSRSSSLCAATTDNARRAGPNSGEISR